ncbi:uncharacterized protein TrAtP1_008247 [Trichoderma atroviride]|uniref:uncharacterized protein n=1 Tax=Hypocrea atroviridis TaxID=63577 RepID=UPI00333121D1|nr:hypothetical protein TrAtP1_008247 [Trichoderma atroviride]
MARCVTRVGYNFGEPRCFVRLNIVHLSFADVFVFNIIAQAISIIVKAINIIFKAINIIVKTISILCKAINIIVKAFDVIVKAINIIAQAINIIVIAIIVIAIIIALRLHSGKSKHCKLFLMSADVKLILWHRIKTFMTHRTRYPIFDSNLSGVEADHGLKSMFWHVAGVVVVNMFCKLESGLEVLSA